MLYLKHIRWGVLYFLLCCGIFLGIFFLLELPLEPVLYASGLCLALGLPALLVGFFRFRSRQRLLRQLDLTKSLENLPKAREPLERPYQEQLKILFDARQRDLLEAQRRYENDLDYFTLWTHQIKTPIAAMDLILQSGEGSANSELKNELFCIQQYVSMALGYLRLGSKTTDFVFETCSLDPIVRTAIHTYAGQFIRTRTRIVYEPVTYEVLTDEKWLLFVLEQILSNAVKYAPGGTVTITMEGDTLCIADDGIGISSENLPRIFEKGYTGYHGRRDRRTTGIGLYLCREILCKLGHRIWAESRPGQGTRICMGLGREKLELDQ